MLKGLPYGHGVDWWALGVMVFKMLTGSPPYDVSSEDDSSDGDDSDEGDDDDNDGGAAAAADDDDDDDDEEEEEEKEEEEEEAEEEDAEEEEEKEEEEEEENGDDDEDEDDDADEDDIKLLNKIMNTDIDYPDYMSLAAVSLVIKLLQKDPADRLGADGSIDTMRRHPFFTWIDWKALEEKRVKPPEEKKETSKRRSINRGIFQGFSCINYGVKHG
jgi:serine/threonine protein kinase